MHMNDYMDIFNLIQNLIKKVHCQESITNTTITLQTIMSQDTSSWYIDIFNSIQHWIQNSILSREYNKYVHFTSNNNEQGKKKLTAHQISVWILFGEFISQFTCLKWQLYQAGFHHLDALDQSKGMLEEARRKNVYSQFLCESLGTNRLSVDDGV